MENKRAKAWKKAQARLSVRTLKSQGRAGWLGVAPCARANPINKAWGWHVSVNVVFTWQPVLSWLGIGFYMVAGVAMAREKALLWPLANEGRVQYLARMFLGNVACGNYNQKVWLGFGMLWLGHAGVWSGRGLGDLLERSLSVAWAWPLPGLGFVWTAYAWHTWELELAGSYWQFVF